jgi:hypothetical protein
MQTVEELIRLARSGELDACCIYGPDGDIEADGLYLLAPYPGVVDDTEIYPADVVARGFWQLYAGDQFTDVVTVAFSRIAAPTREQIVAALRHCAEHDTFLDL